MILPLEYYAYSSLFNSLACTSIALFVLYKQPHNPSARLFSLLTFLIAVWAWFYFLWLRVTNNAEKAHLLVRTCMLFVTLIPTVFLHYSTVLTRRAGFRNVHLVNYSLSLLIAPLVFTNAFSVGVGRHLIFPFWPIPGWLFHLHLCQAVVSVVTGLWLTWQAIWRSAGNERARFLWTFWGFGIGWFSAFINYLEWYRVPFPPLFNPFVFIFVAITAYAIIRFQLMDIRIILRRSLVYSLLIACITAAYLVMVLVMERWFQGFFGYKSILATLITAFLIAVFFNPLRDRIQALVDHALFQATPAEMAEQREQLLAEVRKGDQMKAVATLAAGLAHEIKNPLASIKTFTEYLDTKYTDPEFREKFKRIVGGEIERMNLIVQQLLEFAKPSPPKLVPVEVPRLLDDTLELLNNDLLQRKVRVIRSYAPAPPVLGDSQQLKQVFLNLLLNSLQAMNGTGQLTLTTTTKDGKLLITLEDNGCGIPQEHLARLGEPFFSTKPVGTGLGLAIVQSILKEHQGKLLIESTQGKGTAMTLVLPIAT